MEERNMTASNDKHYYQLTGIINRCPIKTSVFVTRPLATDFVCELICKNGLQLESEEFIDKHVEEFKCDDANRFRVERVR